MKEYKLSIIIPTKNRQYYCLAAIKQILSLNIHGVEICIQDNSDNNSLESKIEELNIDSVVYNYHQGVLSFVDNFSEAVSLAHGEFLCMIGDDDGILPSIESIIDYAKENNVDSIIPSLGCVYYWPSENPIIKNGEHGVLSLSFKKERVGETNSLRALNKLLRSAVQDYTSLDMPRLYHGIVRTDCLAKIKKKSGTFFGGLTPDMYMATALCFVCQKTIRINYPITISGICPTSGSTDSATGKHTGNLSDAPHFRGHINYIWDDLIPAFYSVDTIWAETLMHALENFGADNLKNHFNLPLFESICMEKYPQYRQCIIEHMKLKGVSNFSIKYQRFIQLFSIFHKKIRNKFNPKKRVRFYDISDISSACSQTIEYYKTSMKF